jgi:hypothetical protein
MFGFKREVTTGCGCVHVCKAVHAAICTTPGGGGGNTHTHLGHYIFSKTFYTPTNILGATQ